jgi:hypothetical protein
VGEKMGRRKTFGFSFSWKRALGISALRGKIARATGIPTTKSGLQRKIGRSALGIGAGIATGAAAATAYQATTNTTRQQAVSQPRTKKKSSCVNIVGGLALLIIVIAVCGSLLSHFTGGGNSTPTPTRIVQAQIIHPTRTQIPTITPTYTFTPTPSPTLTSTPYPPGFRPTDTRWPTLTKGFNTTPYVLPPSGGTTTAPTIVWNTPTTIMNIPTSTSNNPTGATALCKDGTLSYSKTHSGTCSHHGGVAVWYK